jgi:FkbM family methyltransferase
MIMSRCGFNVTSFEPDPKHFSWLTTNISLNDCNTVMPIQAAVSDSAGELEFVRVLGNTTSSHLAGAKPNPYGELERFSVRVESIAEIMKSADFVKMDAEGQEGVIVLGTNGDHWSGTDMMLEVGSEKNAKTIYEHLHKVDVNAFAQKQGWCRVDSLEQMPTSYRDGSLFLTRKHEMPWK